MTLHDERPRLRLRTVDDALGLIPHLLGFHPEESLVVLVVDGGQVAVTARIDLRDAVPPDGVEAVLERIWRRFPLADGWFVAYTDDHGAGWDVLGRCDAFLPPEARRRLTLVDGDTWWIDEPCGPVGRHDPGSSALAAEATVHGLVARPSRSDVERLLDGPPEADLDHLVAVAERTGAELAQVKGRRWPGLMAAVLARCRLQGRLDDDGAALLAALSTHPDARDVALLSISRADADQHVDLWRQVVNRTLPVHQGYPLALLGMAAWITGEGALAAMCLERAERLVPYSRLVGILSLVIEAVVPPTLWDDLRPELLATASTPVRRAAARPVSRAGR